MARWRFAGFAARGAYPPKGTWMELYLSGLSLCRTSIAWERGRLQSAFRRACYLRQLEVFGHNNIQNMKKS